jgi:sugar lactone lactonase YvrE
VAKSTLYLVRKAHVKKYPTEILFEPNSSDLRFLPEGPYPCDRNQLSWVAIQHGADAKVGSLNIFDFSNGKNRSFELPGRPGFAFPSDREDIFVIGLERTIGLFDLVSGKWTPFIHGIDENVAGTIINDGVVFTGGLIFGTKDVRFQEQKAGLYLWRYKDRELIQLRDDQICSNGKVVLEAGGRTTLLDVDSPTKIVVAYDLDVDAGTVSEPKMVVDLRKGDVFPDGMIVTPDEKSVIISMYNPGDAEYGETRQYGIASGTLEAVWKCKASPQVTCPQLVDVDGRAKLVMTTAVEHMPAERREKYPGAGCLFIGETPFEFVTDAPVFQIS